MVLVDAFSLMGSPPAPLLAASCSLPRALPPCARRSRVNAEYRDVVERRVYTVTGQHADEEEIEKMIETGESEMIFQKAILEQVRRGCCSYGCTLVGAPNAACLFVAAAPCRLLARPAPCALRHHATCCALGLQGRGYVLDTLAEIRERRDAGAGEACRSMGGACMQLPNPAANPGRRRRRCHGALAAEAISLNVAATPSSLQSWSWSGA